MDSPFIVMGDLLLIPEHTRPVLSRPREETPHETFSDLLLFVKPCKPQPAANPFRKGDSM
jgi:hypothetical protein